MSDTPRTDAFVSRPEVWHYSGFCDGLDCRIARESTRDFAERLERELNEATAKLRMAREGIVTIAHGGLSRLPWQGQSGGRVNRTPSITLGLKGRSVNALVGLLESRHTAMLEWVEPWPACGPKGNTLDAHVTLRATVHDCINLQRAADGQAGRPTMGDDEQRLDEFMVVHWATVVQPNDQAQFSAERR